MIKKCDTIIYYWPKDKSEARFQIMNLISCLSTNTEIFIVGHNASGVKSASSIFKNWIQLKKIDSAKHSILMSGLLKKKGVFILEDFFQEHVWKKLIIKSLPGVFGYKKIDPGSKLLASTFSNHITGKVLDMGCGTGFLSVSLLRLSPHSIITLVDNNIAALKCSQSTLAINNLQGKVVCSDLYSQISQKFNLIISNPPFHYDLKINFHIIEKIISNSKKYLTKNGELRFVINNFLNYDLLLNKHFKKYYILKKTSKYKVYQAFA